MSLCFIAAGQLRAESALCCAPGHMLVCKCWTCPLNVYLAVSNLVNISNSPKQVWNKTLTWISALLILNTRQCPANLFHMFLIHRFNHFWLTSQSESCIMLLATSGNECIIQNGKRKEVNVLLLGSRPLNDPTRSCSAYFHWCSH